MFIRNYRGDYRVHHFELDRTQRGRPVAKMSVGLCGDHDYHVHICPDALLRQHRLSGTFRRIFDWSHHMCNTFDNKKRKKVENYACGYVVFVCGHVNTMVFAVLPQKMITITTKVMKNTKSYLFIFYIYSFSH